MAEIKTTRRYLVMPGYVISIHDGQRRYISGPELMRLYHVDPKDCLVVESDEEALGLRPQPDTEDVFLFPNAHGNYTVPK